MTSRLEAIAFGQHTGATVRPAGSARDHWLAAVALGGQGRYAAAATLLDPLRRAADPVVAALAGATLASHRRQLGGHAVARRLDGVALRVLTAKDTEDTEDAAEARSDVLLGLAADALGLGLSGVAHALLAEAGRLSGAGWRHPIRLAWVSAEVLLADGRAADAVPHAERGAELAAGSSSVRHQVKSGMVLGAALATAGSQLPRAVELLRAVVRDGLDGGLLPLVWPSALLLADLDAGQARAHHEVGAAALRTVLRRTDPVGRHLAEASPWVPDPAR